MPNIITNETAENIIELFDQIASSENQDEILRNVALIRKIAGDKPSAIIKQIYVQGKTHISVDGFYTLEQFLECLHLAMGRTYGWRSDYIKATETNPDVRPVKNDDVQKWQMTGLVPEWAYDQIKQLVFVKRKGQKGPTWSNDEYEFLAEICNKNPKLSNIQLAYICSEKFGRDLNENAIKASIDRLRKRGLLPKYRKKII